MRRLWFATWGACSWAPASGAAFTTPALCPTRRAELQPRASLWTAPRSPWRTVSDTSHALGGCKHVQLLVPHSAEFRSLCCRLRSANWQLFKMLSRCHFSVKQTKLSLTGGVWSQPFWCHLMEHKIFRSVTTTYLWSRIINHHTNRSQTFVGSSFSNVRIFCFSLFYIIAHKIGLVFGLLS